uniref:thioredoxin-dependent peroxiredoxin n=1 Tax=Pfiesteria piscicida TaxID=71001 RepID=A3E3W1_PFIPI|nr:alkyl-hydroperoxide reductase [Pfiesteria piscicida]
MAWLTSLLSSLLLIRCATGELPPGSAFPPLTFRDDRGATVKLGGEDDDSFPGKRVVIWWYPKADTPGCTKEGTTFQRLHQAYGAKNVVILGASADSEEENRAFAEKFGFKYPLLCDVGRTLPDALSVDSRRWAVLIGPDRTIEKIWLDISDPEDWPVTPLIHIAQSEVNAHAEL